MEATLTAQYFLHPPHDVIEGMHIDSQEGMDRNSNVETKRSLQVLGRGLRSPLSDSDSQQNLELANVVGQLVNFTKLSKAVTEGG